MSLTSSFEAKRPLSYRLITNSGSSIRMAYTIIRKLIDRKNKSRTSARVFSSLIDDIKMQDERVTKRTKFSKPLQDNIFTTQKLRVINTEASTAKK